MERIMGVNGESDRFSFNLFAFILHVVIFIQRLLII